MSFLKLVSNKNPISLLMFICPSSPHAYTSLLHPTLLTGLSDLSHNRLLKQETASPQQKLYGLANTMDGLYLYSKTHSEVLLKRQGF